MDNLPTEITREDIENFVANMMTAEIQKKNCWNCSKDFLPSYSSEVCDECFFSKFPKKERDKFYRSFLE